MPQNKKKYKSSFLEGLFSMLQTFEFNDIIRWNVDGKSFEITSPRKFINSVAPKYYKLKNMNSFLKQINMYKFQKAGNLGGAQTFSHPLFLRDSPELLKTIERKYVPPKGKSPKEELSREINQVKKKEEEEFIRENIDSSMVRKKIKKDPEEEFRLAPLQIVKAENCETREELCKTPDFSPRSDSSIFLRENIGCIGLQRQPILSVQDNFLNYYERPNLGTPFHIPLNQSLVIHPISPVSICTQHQNLVWTDPMQYYNLEMTRSQAMPGTLCYGLLARPMNI